MEPEYANSYKPTLQSIILVRSFLKTHFSLPFEIVSLILEEAGYWVCIHGTGAESFPHSFRASSTLLKTPPLGTTHSPMVEVGFGRREAKMKVREKAPCREIRVQVQARPWKIPETDGRLYVYPSPVYVDLGPTRDPFVMDILRGKRGPSSDESEVKENMTFGIERGAFDLHPERYQNMKVEEHRVVLLEEPLKKDQITARDFVFKRTDEGAAGDLVRALSVGDSVQLKSNLPHVGWGVWVWKLQLEVFYSV